jgi:hypothetical protein
VAFDFIRRTGINAYARYTEPFRHRSEESAFTNTHIDNGAVREPKPVH